MFFNTGGTKIKPRGEQERKPILNAWAAAKTIYLVLLKSSCYKNKMLHPRLNFFAEVMRHFDRSNQHFIYISTVNEPVPVGLQANR
jgi:hypothetical protein